jgi:hypothetical protein
MLEGIDDPVLREPIGVIVNVGLQRQPEDIRPTFKETLLLNPENRGNTWTGTGYKATIQYLTSYIEILTHQNHAEKVKAFCTDLMQAVEQKLNLPILPNQNHHLWIFEHPIQQAENHRPVLIQVKGPGMVHAGVERNGNWTRIYDIPLKQVSRHVWEATILDPDVNAFTFIWYDTVRSGMVRWEGKNYILHRT